MCHMSEDVAGAQISDGTLAGGPSRTATNSPPLVSEKHLAIIDWELLDLYASYTPPNIAMGKAYAY